MVIRKVCSLGFAALCLGLLGGCETGSSLVFPTAEAVARAGTGSAADVATLAAGRKIFTTSCTECHVARPIALLSVAQWRRIVGVMAPRARLKENDRAALEAYLVAARESLPRG